MAPKISSESVHEKVLMIEKQTEEFRENTRSDFIRVFEKLDMIHAQLEVIKSAPTNNEELSLQRAALADQNRRIGVLETDKAVVIGGKTLLVSGCALLGFLILAAIDYFKK